MITGFGFIQSKERILKEELGARNYEIMQRMKNITEMKGAQMLLPYDLNIK